MALTRKLLKGMSLSDEQMDTIIEAHTDTVDGLKAKITDLEEQVKDIPALQKKLEQAEEALSDAENGGWKEKHDTVKKEFDDYKKAQSDKEAKQAKEKAVRAYYESKNIVGKSLEIAMRGSRDEIDAVELEDGKIKDAAALDALIAGDFAGLVGTTTTRGADTQMPPTNTGGTTVRTREEILKIKDTSERQKAWADYLKAEKGS